MEETPLQKYENSRVICPRCGRSIAAPVFDAGLHSCSGKEES